MGPYAGGSLVTVHGEYLDTGVKRNVLIGDTPCSKTTESLVGLERHKVRGNDSRMYLVYTQKYAFSYITIHLETVNQIYSMKNSLVSIKHVLDICINKLVN